MINRPAILVAVCIAVTGCDGRVNPTPPVLSDRLGSYNAQVMRACANAALKAWQADKTVDADLLFKLCIHEKGVRSI